MRVVVDNGPGRRRTSPVPRLKRAAPVVALRSATSADAPALHALITSHVQEGHLLPRTLDELLAHAPRFVVAVTTSKSAERIIGCAELAPLSGSVAEVRSLVVGRDARGVGLGRRIVDELGRRARRDGFFTLCAFAHDARFFVGLGFSIVPHTWVPEKIAHDCVGCPLFRACGQYAMLLELGTIVQNRREEPRFQNLREEPRVQNLRKEPMVQNLRAEPMAQNLRGEPAVQTLRKESACRTSV